jgi:predicted peptidase
MRLFLRGTKKVQRAYRSAWLPYLLHVPEQAQADSLPMIVFLHGSGERGSDPDLIKASALPALLDDQPDFPFAVLSPQCPSDKRWTHLADSVAALIDQIILEYAIDPKRVYLTGFSMGGQGVWHIGSLYPERFAALAPVSGRIPPRPNFMTGDLCNLRDVPVWAIHSQKDTLVPVENTTTLVTALIACGGTVRVTLFPDLDHDQTSATTYNSGEFYDWLLTCRKP